MNTLLKTLKLMFVAGAVGLIAGCGGGGSSTPVPVTLTLSASGTLPTGTQIGGIKGTIAFPAGTSMRTDPAKNGEILSGLMNTTGSAASSLAVGKYASSSLTFAITNGNGFSTGDFATVLADVESGVPTAANFSITNVTVIDTNEVDISSLVSVTLR